MSAGKTKKSEFIRSDQLCTAVLVTSAEREGKDSQRSGMYQSCHFLTRLDRQSLQVFGFIRLFDEVRAELV